MRRQDGKPTTALAARVHELKEVKTQRESSTRKETAPIAHSQAARHNGKEDDMSDSLEETSKLYAEGGKNNQE